MELWGGNCEKEGKVVYSQWQRSAESDGVISGARPCERCLRRVSKRL